MSATILTRPLSTTKRAARRSARGAEQAVGPRGAHRHLITTTTGTWAVFLLGDEPWAFRSLDARRRSLQSQQFRWADLAGHRVHLRVTDRPVDSYRWAGRLDAMSTKALADPEGHAAWNDYLGATQGYIDGAGLHTTETYVAVRLTDKAITTKNLPRLLADEPLTGHLAAVRRDLSAITTSLAREGFNAQPVAARRLAHLLHASAGLGVPVPASVFSGVDETMDTAGLDAAASAVTVSPRPYAPHLRVNALRDGKDITSYTTTLTLGAQLPRRPDRASFEPWGAYPRKFPFPTELSAIIDVEPAEETAPRAKRQRRIAEDQVIHFAAHGERPSALMESQIVAARRTENEIVNGTRQEAVRGYGQWRISVSATDPEVLVTRVAQVINDYAQDQGTTIEHTHNQAGLYDEFMPGAPRAANGGHVRAMPAAYLATALPNLSSDLGDGVGPVLGQVVSGGAGAVCIDPTWGPRNSRSGLMIAVGTPGSGKSTAAGLMAYTSVLRGHRTIINDPSGPLAALTRMPQIAKVSRHLDLASAQPGILNPYAMVFDPDNGDPDVTARWDVAVAEADAERRDSLIDTFLGLLDPKFADSQGVLQRIETATQETEAHYGQSPWAVIDHLERGDDTCRQIASTLTTVSSLKGGALIFPPRTGAGQDPTIDLDGAILTVITMRGLPTPTPGTPRSTWSRSERMAQPVLALAGKYAARAMYLDREAKLIVTDELGQITGSGSGFKAGIARAAVDSRKHFTAYLAMGQTGAQVEAIGEEIMGLASVVIIGWMQSEESAARAVRFLGIPDGHGYEQYPLGFPTGRDVARQFLIRDARGRVGVVQVDLDHLPQLRETLNTDPGLADDVALADFAVPA